MRKKVLALVALALTFFALPFSHAATPEIISSAEARDLGLAIPASTPAGHQIVTIEVTDANGNSVTRDIAFCKSAGGKIYWSNVCPAVTHIEITPTPKPSATATEAAVTKTPDPAVGTFVRVEKNSIEHWKIRDIVYGAISLIAAFFISRRARKNSSIDLQIIALAFEIDFLIFIGDYLIGHNIFLWAAAIIFGAPRLRKLLKLNQASTN